MVSALDLLNKELVMYVFRSPPLNSRPVLQKGLRVLHRPWIFLVGGTFLEVHANPPFLPYKFTRYFLKKLRVKVNLQDSDFEIRSVIFFLN